MTLRCITTRLRLVLILATCAVSTALAESPTILSPAPWQQPTLTTLPDALQITVVSQPAGVILTHTVDEPARYRLIVEGRGGPMTLRLRLDDGPPEYLAAPNGSSSRPIAGFRRLEALIYSDSPAT